MVKKLLFILLLFSNKYFASVQTRIKVDVLIVIDSYDTVKESVLNHIKQYEKNHKNVVGLTGYGHKTYSDSIINLSEKQADSLLRIDFEKCIDIVPDSYNEYQKLFVAAFIYNCGRGTFAKCLSGRKRMIDVCRYKE